MTYYHSTCLSVCEHTVATCFLLATTKGVWQTKERQWAQPFPSMPTARSSASSTCYKHWLVVADGYKDHKSIDTVEILDVTTSQWSTGPSTPTPFDIKSVIIENTWYLMGGSCRSKHDVYSASLEAIVIAQPSQSTSIWQKLSPLESTYACPQHWRLTSSSWWVE